MLLVTFSVQSSQQEKDKVAKRISMKALSPVSDDFFLDSNALMPLYEYANSKNPLEAECRIFKSKIEMFYNEVKVIQKTTQ